MEDDVRIIDIREYWLADLNGNILGKLQHPETYRYGNSFCFFLKSIKSKMKSCIKKIHPQEAETLLAKSLNRNRRLNKAQVTYYARQMKEGLWKLNGESIIIDTNGYVIDGQHRLSAVIEAGIPVDFLVVEDVDSECFTTIDQGRTRSNSDVFFIADVKYGTVISSAVRRFLLLSRSRAASFKTLAHSGNIPPSLRVSPEETLAEYRRNPDFWQEKAVFASQCYNSYRFLGTSEIAGTVAYLISLGYDDDFVCGFFRELFFDKETTNQTLAVLRKRLINDAMSSKNVRMTSLYKTQIIIKAWNAYKTGAEYKVLSWNQSREGLLSFV